MSSKSAMRFGWLGSLAVVLATVAAAPSISQQPAKAKLPEGAKVLRALEYVKGGHERQKLDLYLPAKADGPLPVIVWIHGGAWSGGSRDNPGQALAFVDKGYALASVSHRFSQQAVFPAQIEDCRAAIRWLRANAKTYGLDADHIGVWGASSGGHLVALLGTAWQAKELDGKLDDQEYSSRVQAVVDFFGPTDFLQMDAHAVKGGLKHDPPNSPESKLVGGPIQDNVEKVKRANPITYITKDTPPFFIAHGENDTSVPWHQSELLYEALKKAGVEVTFQKIPGAGHGGPQFSTEKMQDAIQEFFDKHLKGRPEANAKTSPQPK
jgi:acetyl esterase/lipase